VTPLARAQTPTASLKGLRVYLAERDAPPVEVPPPPSLRKYWTRRGIAEWLVEKLTEDVPSGDHARSRAGCCSDGNEAHCERPPQ
jgi:hypothetical protein